MSAPLHIHSCIYQDTYKLFIFFENIQACRAKSASSIFVQKIAPACLVKTFLQVMVSCNLMFNGNGLLPFRIQRLSMCVYIFSFIYPFGHIDISLLPFQFSNNSYIHDVAVKFFIATVLSQLQFFYYPFVANYSSRSFLPYHFDFCELSISILVLSVLLCIPTTSLLHMSYYPVRYYLESSNNDCSSFSLLICLRLLRNRCS